jgi:hypothetical protein
MLREMGGEVEGDGWLSLREMGGSLGSNPDTSPKKLKNGRHKQMFGEHTLTRQQNIHKNKPLIKKDDVSCTLFPILCVTNQNT